ncbi:MAG TPA: pyroglutamyl-peptidase I, partial [Clostridiales bacterium]|nr:pyroglutamyl-peptidase I [Clostridiales bacterium]
IKVVWKAMEKYKPDVVLSLGQAGGRSCISIERIAININDTKSADNQGQTPEDQTIFEDGQPAYFSTLPIKKILHSIREIKIPAEISNSAGTFVCNHVMYGVLYKIQKEGLDMKAGFIHVPFIPEQVIDYPGKPSMSLNDIVKAVEVACKVPV